MIISWYLAVLGGWLVLNILRIFFMTIFTPRVVLNEKQNEEAYNIRKITGSACLIDFLFICEEAKEMMKDMFIVTTEVNKTTTEYVYQRPSEILKSKTQNSPKARIEDEL